MYQWFERWTEPLPETPPEPAPSGLIAFCRHYSKGFEKPLLCMSLLTALLAILEVSLFGFLGQLVDWLSHSNPETFLADEGDTLLWMGAIILIGIPLCILLHSLIIFQSLLGNFPMAIRYSAHRYLLRQSISFYSNDFAGRIVTKVMQTALAVRETVIKLLDSMVHLTIFFVSMIVMMAAADLQLVWPVLVWLTLYITTLTYFIPRLQQSANEQADARSTMSGRIVDSYTNINTVKLFAHTDQESEYAKNSMQSFLITVYKQMRYVTGFIVTVNFINYALLFSVAALSIHLWLQQSIGIGAIAIAVSLALRLNSMSQKVMWEFHDLFENIGTVKDGIDTLTKPISIVDKPNAPALMVKQGRIDFDQVQFSYDPSKAVINQLQLNIKAGEKIGLVGRSGAGKSTLVNLLMRFYEVQGGAIKIDGHDLRDISQDSLRSQIGMVTQDTSLLHRTIRENILYGRPEATEAELFKALQQAHADQFIDELTDIHGKRGLDALVGERGVKLSGGQRQRIAIARVLLKNAPILILDEATSALDSEVEAAIQESLYQLMEGKTVIAIAHRLSTIAAMDRLIVFDKGEIVEQGSHQELLAKNGIYAQLWAHQTGGFLGLD